MTELVFKELAQSKGQGEAQAQQVRQQVAFVKVDLGVGVGSIVAREYGVTARPRFSFFLDGTAPRRQIESSNEPSNSVCVRTIAALVADLPAASMFPLFDAWRGLAFHPRTNNCRSHVDAARQSTDNKQRISVIVIPADAPYTAASDNERRRHATFPIPASGGEGSEGECGAYERACTDGPS